MEDPDLPEERPTDAGRPMPGENGSHVTFCRLCEAYCGLIANVEDGRITKVLPDRSNPASLGHVCIKGTSAHHLVDDPDRVLTPLRRCGAAGEFEPVSWDEALADIARRLAAIIRSDGSQAVANYFGNPAAFNNGAMGSIPGFMNHFGIRKTFSAASLDITSRQMAWYILYGSAFLYAIPDLPRTDFALIFGSNPLVSHGSGFTDPRIRSDLDDIAARGRVVVVDPRRTETARCYEHLPIRPDTDVWLLAAMVNTLFEAGKVDVDALSQVATNLGELQAAIGWIDAELAEGYCGIPAARIRSLALDFAATPRAVAFGRIGICRGTFPTLANLLVDVLNLVTGRFGVPGGWAFGDDPTYRGRMPVGMRMVQTRFGPEPWISNSFHISLLADEIQTPGEGQVRALFIETGNIVLSAPGGQQLEDALESLDLFVSHDLYMTETNRHADYILPGVSFFEREDLPVIAVKQMVRPFVQYTRPVVLPSGEGRNEDDVFNRLAVLLHDELAADPGNSGYGQKEPPQFSPTSVYDQMLRAAGASIDTGEGPVPLSMDLLADNPHGLRLSDGLRCIDSQSKIMHPDGMIHLWDAMLDDQVERLRATQPHREDELRLISIRNLKSLNSWMHNIDKLSRSQTPVLQMNPRDAERRGLSNGDAVRVRSEAGEIRTTVSVTDDLVSGVVTYPHGWGHGGGSWRRANATRGANVNLLSPLRAGERLSASSLLDSIVVEVEAVAN